MGCDGGTIPKRKEVVKSKHKDQGRNRNEALSAKWQFCALSGLKLKKPIVSCQLGQLYNKDAIIEYLLEAKNSKSSLPKTSATHIKSLKDIKELKLKEKLNFNNSHQASSGNEQFKAQFVCPISGLDLNGKYKFYYLLTCGCVFSERARKEVPNNDQCILCFKPYDSFMDLIVLNGEQEELDELKEKLSFRRRSVKSAKRLHCSSNNHSQASSSTSKDLPTEERQLVKKSKQFKAETVR